jgi:NAD(P)-dependent dehydrogenase (short-subunit alcohol dehydrogenase family)
MKLENRVAVVTGGNKGLGRALCLALAEEGARVAVAGRSVSRNKEVADEVSSRGAEAMAVSLDVTDLSSVEQMTDTVLSRWGQIDILINNAATTSPMEWIVDYDPDEWERVIAVNLRGPFLCSRAVLPNMIERRTGKIVNVAAGVMDERVEIGVAAYCASKAGLVNFTRQLAGEVKRHGIFVNAIDPGGLDTAMTDDIKEGQRSSTQWAQAQQVEEELRLRPPEAIAPMVMFLVSDDSNMMTGRFLQASSRGNPLYLQL